MKFYLPNFKGRMGFNIWRVQLIVIRTQNGLKKTLGGKDKKLDSMINEQWEELDAETLSVIQLSVEPHDPHKILQNTIAAKHWLPLLRIYRT